MSGIAKISRQRVSDIRLRAWTGPVEAARPMGPARFAFPLVVWALWRAGHAVLLCLAGGEIVADSFRFDGTWFLSILESGYAVNDPSFTTWQNPAFFPGLVWLTEPLSWIVGDRSAALMVANGSGLSAFVAVFAATRVVIGEQAARHAVIAFALWPVSFVMTAFYSEGLFITLVALAVWAERTGRCWLASASVAAAAMTRTVGAALGLALAAARLARRRRLDAATVLYGASGPAGVLVVCVAQERQTGLALAWMHAQEAWGRGLAGPWVPIWRAGEGIGAALPGVAAELAFNLGAVAVATGALLLATRRYRDAPTAWPMLACGWAALVVPLCSSVPSSQARFALAAWPASLAVERTPTTNAGRLGLLAAGGIAVALTAVLVHRWTEGGFVV